MIGKRLADRYELLDRVGGGGMAVVYKANDVLLDRIVAVKVLRPQYAIDDDFVYRFRREAQAAARLSHPNVVSIYDVGVEEEIHYIVMEFVEGSTLKEYITKYAPIDIQEAVEITKQIAEALDHAHHNQIIHRDIKPHNILIGKNRRVKVTDFGIARAVTSSTITHTGSVIGSVHYFSPEQARGGVTGEKSDIYSLGIVLYEMVTGKLPFTGDSPISVALKHLQETYTEPRQINSTIPQSIENIIMRSLAKDPIQRYASARKLMDDLDTALEPRRLDDKKVIIDDHFEDEEATKVIPVIHSDAFETKVVQKSANSGQEEEEEWEEEESKSKRSLWFTLGISFIILLVLLFAAYQGVKFVGNLLHVEEIVVEDVTNLPVDEAIEILKGQNLIVNNTLPRNSDEVEEGHVIRQDPISGASVKENTYVTLTVSIGKEKEAMPRLVSLLEQTALRLVTEYKDIEIIEEFSKDVVAGQVIRQEPEANEMVVPGDTIVKLYISKGAEKVEMPNLIGKTLAEAEADLTKRKLILETPPEEDFSDLPEGQVFRQESYQPGEELEAGTVIKIWISKGYKEKFREKIVELPIALDMFEEAQISIFITDENGDRGVVEERIYESKTYQLSVKVNREQDALVKVFKNNELYERREITFD